MRTPPPCAPGTGMDILNNAMLKAQLDVAGLDAYIASLAAA